MQKFELTATGYNLNFRPEYIALRHDFFRERDLDVTVNIPTFRMECSMRSLMVQPTLLPAVSGFRRCLVAESELYRVRPNSQSLPIGYSPAQ